jgi:hypothetical protein
MRSHLFAAFSLAVGLAALPLQAGAQPASHMEQGAIRALPLDTPVMVNGVETACTGIGLAARNDPRWKAFPVRLEFSGPHSEYLSDETVFIEGAGGAQVMAVSCQGAWLLLKLPKGRFVVRARINGETAKERSMTITTPASGQARFVLQFPDA